MEEEMESWLDDFLFKKPLAGYLLFGESIITKTNGLLKKRDFKDKKYWKRKYYSSKKYICIIGNSNIAKIHDVKCDSPL